MYDILYGGEETLMRPSAVLTVHSQSLVVWAGISISDGDEASDETTWQYTH